MPAEFQPTTAHEPRPKELVAALGVGCRRGEHVLFRGLTFELEPGQVLWLRGSNGRGKTSLLRVLAGLSRPEGGRIVRPVPFLYLAHHNALKEDLSALEALAFLAELHGQAADATALGAALERFGLQARRDAPVRTLSQGQRRRVALARLLLHPSKPLWLLDEPYDALDLEASALLDEVISEHARAGGAVMLTSHTPLAIREPALRELRLDDLAALA